MLLHVRKTAIYAVVNIFYKAVLPTKLLYSYNFIPRIPALIFGVLSVIILYDAFRRHIGKTSAFITGCLSCASYPLIIYAIRSRVYSMTHFFVAIYIWLYLSILKDITKRKLIMFLIFSFFGFFTYPYLVFTIYIFYICLGINILYKKSNHKQLFYYSFITFFLISFIFLIITKSTFSHNNYKTILLSYSFFIYALKGMLSYYSGNSYILVLLSFLIPFINLFYAFKKQVNLNYIYLLWAMFSLLIILHIIIVSHTKNAFNPRHVTFITIPFIAGLTCCFNEIYNNMSKLLKRNKYHNYYKVIFFIAIFLISFSTRDFKYYIKTGINYHGGSNKYSENINFINNIIDDFGEDYLILIPFDKNINYSFYFYRSNKRIVNFHDLKKDDQAILDNYSDSLYIGFIYHKDIKYEDVPFSIRNNYVVYKKRELTVIISNNRVKKKSIENFIEKHLHRTKFI